MRWVKVNANTLKALGCSDPMSRVEAYLWLIMHSNAGRFSYSLRYLGNAWGWSFSAVRRFLDLLSNAGFIRPETASETKVKQKRHRKGTENETANYLILPHKAGSSETGFETKVKQKRHKLETLSDTKRLDKEDLDLNPPIVPPRGKIKKQVEPVEFPESLDTEACREAWSLWTAYRKDRGIGYKSALSASQQLRRWADRPEEFPAAIKFSIAQGYQGIFPDKSQGRTRHWREEQEATLRSWWNEEDQRVQGASKERLEVAK